MSPEPGAPAPASDLCETTRSGREEQAGRPGDHATWPLSRPLIVLTGGPGGGKSALLRELRADPAWAGRLVCLPETAHYARETGISARDKLFQRVAVCLQRGLEDGLDRALGPADLRPLLCHRGTLDPLAFWLLRGWPQEEFFERTGTTRKEHYRRYAAVIHLVTAADGAPQAYERWPRAHRPESLEEAIRLDRLLERIWSAHPRYYRLDNAGRDWAAKAAEARRILAPFILRRQAEDRRDE